MGLEAHSMGWEEIEQRSHQSAIVDLMILRGEDRAPGSWGEVWLKVKESVPTNLLGGKAERSDEVTTASQLGSVTGVEGHKEGSTRAIANGAHLVFKMRCHAVPAASSLGQEGDQTLFSEVRL